MLFMDTSTYQQARRLGLKEVKTRTARHEDPYLPSLEEILPHMSALNEVDLGSTRIDIEQILDYGAKSINGLSHICVTTDDIYVICHGDITNHTQPPRQVIT